MPTKLNGFDVNLAYFNGNEVQNIIFNGTTVFTATQQTISPTLYNYIYNAFKSTITVNIINNDPDTVTMYAEIVDSTPDVDVGTWLTDEDKTHTFYGVDDSYTVYAMASATGKDYSDIISISS